MHPFGHEMSATQEACSGRGLQSSGSFEEDRAGPGGLGFLVQAVLLNGVVSLFNGRSVKLADS